MDSRNYEEDLRSEEEDLTQGSPINDIHEVIRQGEAREKETSDRKFACVSSQPNQIVIQNSRTNAQSFSNGSSATSDSAAIPVEVIVDSKQDTRNPVFLEPTIANQSCSHETESTAIHPALEVLRQWDLELELLALERQRYNLRNHIQEPSFIGQYGAGRSLESWSPTPDMKKQ